MIARQGTWSEIGRDSYIRDKFGKPFRVVGVTTREVHLIDPSGSTRKIEVPPDHAPVTILEPTTEEVVGLLGGEIVEVQMPGVLPLCPDFEHSTVAAQRRHLQGKHDVEESTQGLDRPTLAAIHRRAHLDSSSHLHSKA